MSLPGSVWRLEIQLVSRLDLPSDWELNDDPWRAFVDACVIGSRLRLRTRQPGDRFQPLGMAGKTVKLSDFFTNQKVPREVRERLPILDSDAGIAWVCGYRVDERAAIRESTREALIVHFVHQDGR
jgi:tRNA(Ile)-lysidine synthase